MLNVSYLLVLLVNNSIGTIQPHTIQCREMLGAYYTECVHHFDSVDYDFCRVMHDVFHNGALLCSCGCLD